MTADPFAHMVFSRIETRAVLPDGRVITAWHSFPRGVGKDVYDAIDRALVRAYGRRDSRTVGTPLR
jgi:hypothetical protein